MRIVVRDHDRNRREVYNIRTIRSRKNSNVKDSDDDKIKDLEERVKALEKEIKELSDKADDNESEEPEEIDVDEEDLDEVEEPEGDDEEKVEDLGDGCNVGDSIKPLPRKSLQSIGATMKSTANDSINDEQAEINAWSSRKSK